MRSFLHGAVQLHVLHHAAGRLKDDARWPRCASGSQR
jgi:hypothetical protein